MLFYNSLTTLDYLILFLGPKNYAEWRSSWHNDRKTNHSENVANAEGGGSYHENDIYTQVRSVF